VAHKAIDQGFGQFVSDGVFYKLITHIVSEAMKHLRFIGCKNYLAAAFHTAHFNSASDSGERFEKNLPLLQGLFFSNP
jgi:hypothetical protein